MHGFRPSIPKVLYIFLNATKSVFTCCELHVSNCHTQLIKNVFTDAYLYDPTTLEQLTACLEQITELVRKANIDVSENELVLDLQRGDDGEILCGYYFVDHAARSLFWLEVFDISPLLSEVRGATMPSHISTPYSLTKSLHVTHTCGSRA